MNQQETDQKVTVQCHGIDKTPYLCSVANPEKPGQYCFPPLASLITGAARLMLALLEKCVTSAGGTFAMEDTDSMAIVATKAGGLIPCPGGPKKLKEGEAVKALSWRQVQGIAKRFEQLNPYDRSAVPGSILKIEDDNFEPKTGKQRQIWCLAISAKRYALLLKDSKNNPALLRKGLNSTTNHWSEHGLGHLLNPTDPKSEDRGWIAQVWVKIIRKSLSLRTKKLGFESVPAVGQITVSSPTLLKPFEPLNAAKLYSAQIKPFNFLLTCHILPLGQPPNVDPEHFHLVSPFESDSRVWLRRNWIDQYSGKEFRVSTTQSGRTTARVKSFSDVVTEYEFHAESKCADATGVASTKQSVGLLRRRQIFIDAIKYIGKESNRLEEVDAGFAHDLKSAYVNYIDPRRDEWETKILPALRQITLSTLVKETTLSRRTLINARRGHRRPHYMNRNKIIQALQKLNAIK